MKKQLIIGIILCSFLLGIIGCIEETDDEEDEKKVDSPLNILILTLNDLNGDYEKFDEEYVTEPYIVPRGLLLEGWNVLEKYEVRFSKNETNFIIQTLARLESKEKCEEFIDKVESQNMSYTFQKGEIELIGDESYIGKNITTMFDKEVALYLLCFRIEDVIVVFLSSEILMDDLVDYAKIVENNINNVIENE
jgi:hypothetical protein